jgi:AcrR family transcriptional regulator
MTVPNNATHERILDAAEALFHNRGYKAVTLRHIADAVGMQHASLYYYAPDGKEQLFVEVMERSFHRRQDNMTNVIAEAGGEFKAQIHAVARWLATSPPMDFSRMLNADMPAIAPEKARKVMRTAYDAMRLPLHGVFEQASARGEIDVRDFDLAAMALVSLMQSVHGVPGLETEPARVKVAAELTDMLLNGWLRR